MVIINSFEDYKSHEGKELGVSDWHKIDQAQINKFADATLDHQWIHVDEEKAKTEGPFKSTIDVRNVKMEINYGIENFKFGQAVLVDSDVQLKATVKSITNLRGIVKAVIQATLIIRNETKPAYVGDVIFLYHFN